MSDKPLFDITFLQGVTIGLTTAAAIGMFVFLRKWSLEWWKRYTKWISPPPDPRLKDLPVIKIGYDVFPDSMPLLVAHRMDEFIKTELNVQLKKVSWSEIFSKLDSRSVDVILGNLQKAQELNDDGFNHQYDLTPELVTYCGFAIMIKHGSYMQTYREMNQDAICMASSSTRELDLLATLGQLRNRKIIAAENTDHFHCLNECLSWAKVDNYHLVGDLTPWDGLNRFLSDNSVEAYVGGVSQRLIAEQSGAVPLVTQSDLDGCCFNSDSNRKLNLIQTNGFVTLNDRKDELGDHVNKLVFVWKNVVRELDSKSPKHVEEFIKQLNYSIKAIEEKSPRFGIKEFKRMWRQWIRLDYN